MLTHIIFVLSDDYFNLIRDNRHAPEKHISTSPAAVSFERTGSLYSETTNLHSFPANNDGIASYPSRDSLFVTDDPKAFCLLKQAQLYVIALYHEKNKNSRFPDALYAVENIWELEYRSYDEAYRRLAGIPWDILETDRLIVRESTPDDIPDFYRIYADPSVSRHMEPLFDDPEEEKSYLQDYIRQFYGFYGFGIWTVILKETGQVIGRAGLNIREGYDLPELGFVIEAFLRNQGLGFEVCRAILTYVKEELGFERLQAFVKKGNAASKKLLEKLGFSHNQEVSENGREYLLYVAELK